VTYCRQFRGRAMRHWWEIEDGPRQSQLPMHSAKKVVVGDTLRARIDAALGALPAPRRAEVAESMQAAGYALPDSHDMTGLRAYAGRLRGLGVDLPPA